MDTGKSLRKTGISPSGEIPSCPHNALLEILSRNHARVVPDGFLRDLPVSMPYIFCNFKKMYGSLPPYLLTSEYQSDNISAQYKVKTE